MSRKRASPTDEDDEDDQKKMDVDSDTEADDEDVENESGAEYSSGEVPFLDTFYGLASVSPLERAQAAHIMLNHCLLGPNANSKDAAYAFRRLLNGLCSGRAAARQGYASALTSFVKIANQSGALKEIQEDEKEDGSILIFLRSQLLKATDPSKPDGGYGKKKGSEERDHQFGRLFGILSVIRSGVLLPQDGEANLEDLKTVASGFTKDLIALYQHRKWMREPTAFAIITMLDSYYALCPQSEAVNVVTHLVSEVVFPEMIADCELAEYSAEQIAIALNIQSQAFENDLKIPAKLNVPVLSKESIPLLAKALGATSIVSHPRAHVVWDVIWCPYLTTQKDPKAKPSKGKPVLRILREELPVCEDSARDLVVSLVQHVITESLLGVESDSGHTSGKSTTHERRALGLSLVKVLCGGATVSSKAGQFRLIVDAALLEDVILTPVIAHKLFIDVICARTPGGAKPSGKQGNHMLKPLALGVLESIAAGGNMPPYVLEQRVACAKALLTCDSRFDGRTKSTTCTNLLMLDEEDTAEVLWDVVSTWQDYVVFLMGRILDTARACADGETSAGYEAIGYIDLLFKAAKKLTRLVQDAENDDFKVRTNQMILAFFFVGAFFDCSKLSNKTKATEAAVRAAAIIRPKITLFPHSLRVVLSSRFYSLLADFTVVAAPSKGPSEVTTGSKNKDVRHFEILRQCSEGWTKLEASGCMRIAGSSGQSADDPDMLDDKAIAGIVTKQQKAAEGPDNNLTSVQRFRIGCASLSTALQLQLLGCGSSESTDGEDELEDDDEDDDEADIKEFITDLASAQHNLVELGVSGKKEGNDNPLHGFAEVCAGILSSPFGGNSQSRGASPKLLRETVKGAWTSALLLCADQKAASSLLDESVLGLLLTSIGAEHEASVDDEEEDDSDDEEMDIDDNDNDAIFTNAAAAGLGMSDDEEENQPQNSKDEDSDSDEDDDGKEVELDASQLQNFLLQDSDDDESMVLEHHAGADKALAKLIRIKQEARKAGQQAREREEMSDQLRCVLLLEVVLLNPGRQLDSLLNAEFVQGLFLPLLTMRRKLEKSLSSGKKMGKRAVTGDSEKRALTEKLASLMKTKLFKLKNVPVVAGSELPKLLGEIMDEVRKAVTDEQISCCTAAMIAVCKMSSSVHELDTLCASYAALVEEWSTKRTTRLKTSTFMDLVQQQKR
jgi:hypothetical protein